MVRVRVLRGVIATGKALVAGTVDDISEADARILVASKKVERIPDEAPTIAESREYAEPPVRETATRSRRRKATLP